jgi:hypothetical protein
VFPATGRALDALGRPEAFDQPERVAVPAADDSNLSPV